MLKKVPKNWNGWGANKALIVRWLDTVLKILVLMRPKTTNYKLFRFWVVLGGKSVDVDKKTLKIPKLFVLIKHFQGIHLKYEENYYYNYKNYDY